MYGKVGYADYERMFGNNSVKQSSAQKLSIPARSGCLALSVYSRLLQNTVDR